MEREITGAERERITRVSVSRCRVQECARVRHRRPETPKCDSDASRKIGRVNAKIRVEGEHGA